LLANHLPLSRNAWETLWNDSSASYQTLPHSKVKSRFNTESALRLAYLHSNSFSPMFRAEQDFRNSPNIPDFLKMVMYHNWLVRAMANYIDGIHSGVSGDVPKGTAGIPVSGAELQGTQLRTDPKTGFSATMFTANRNVQWMARRGTTPCLARDRH